MAANVVYIAIDATAGNASGVINGINQGIAAMGPAAAKSTAQATAGMRGLNIEIRQTQQIMGQFLALVAGGGIARFGVQMVEASDAINKVELAFTTMLHSASDAHSMLLQIRTVAASQPFAFQDLAESAVKMKAFGFEAGMIPQQLNAISDAMAAMGKGKVGLDQLVVALGQMRAKGVVQGQELYRQITEAGILADKYLIAKLKEQTGKVFSPEEVRTLVEKGKLAGKAASDAIIEGMTKDYGGGGKTQGNLPGVQFQKLMDESKKFAAIIVSDLTPAINDLIKTVTRWLKMFEEMPKAQREAIEGWIIWAAQVYVGIKALTALGGLLGSTIKWVKEARTVFGLLGNAMGAAFDMKSWTIFYYALKAGFPELIALATEFALVAPEIVIAAAAIVAGYKAAEYIDKKFLGGDKYAAAKAANEETARLKEAQKAEMLREQGEAKYPKADAFRIQEDGSYSNKKWTTERLIAERKRLVEALLALDKGAAEQEKLLREGNTEEAKHQNDIAQQALEAAQKRELAGIAAVQAGYAGLFREVKGNHDARLKATQALAIDTVRVYQEMLSKIRDAEIKAQEERVKDRARQTEQNLQMLQDRFAMGDNQGAAGGRSVANQFTVFKQATQAAGASAAEILELQLRGALNKMGPAIRSAMSNKTDWALMVKQLEQLWRDYEDDRARIAQDTNYKIQKQTLDLERETVERTRELQKELRDAMAEERVNAINRRFDLAKSKIQQSNQDPLAKRVTDELGLGMNEIARAGALADQQIAELNTALKEQQDRAKGLREANSAIAKQESEKTIALEKLTEFKILTIKKSAADQQLAVANETNAKVRDMNADAMAKMAEEQKRAAEAYVQQQLRVYDKLRGALGKVYDSMLDRSKGFWENVFGGMKTAFENAVRDIVTSRGAAALMRVVTGQPVTMANSADYGDSMFGRIAGFLTARPNVAVPDKVYRTGLKGDVNVVNGAMEVFLNGQSAAVKQDALQTQTKAALGAAAITNAFSLPLRGPASRVGADTGIWYGGTPDAGNGSFNGPGSRAYEAVGWGGASNTAAAMAAANIPGPIGTTVQAATLAKSLGLGKALGFGGAGTGFGIAGLGVAGAGIAGILGGGALGRKIGGVGGGVTAGALGALGGIAGLAGLSMAFPSFFVPLLTAGPVGWIAAAAIGAGIGIFRALHKTAGDKMREKIKQVYGVDVKEKNILAEAVKIAKDKYGGNTDVAVRSPEIQQLVQLYAVSTGQNPTGMPRPMYAASIASAASGLQLQPVYSNGQTVASPYSGATTTQWQDAGIYLQLNPQQANDLFEGKVVNAINNNPSTVAAANASAVASGSSRDAQRGALIEPLTVMA